MSLTVIDCKCHWLQKCTDSLSSRLSLGCMTVAHCCAARQDSALQVHSTCTAWDQKQCGLTTFFDQVASTPPLACAWGQQDCGRSQEYYQMSQLRSGCYPSTNLAVLAWLPTQQLRHLLAILVFLDHHRLSPPNQFMKSLEFGLGMASLLTWFWFDKARHALDSTWFGYGLLVSHVSSWFGLSLEAQEVIAHLVFSFIIAVIGALHGSGWQWELNDWNGVHEMAVLLDCLRGCVSADTILLNMVNKSSVRLEVLHRCALCKMDC